MAKQPDKNPVPSTPPPLRVLRISIDSAGDELELLITACEVYRGTRRWTGRDRRLSSLYPGCCGETEALPHAVAAPGRNAYFNVGCVVVIIRRSVW
jgi:hypothetical protein